MHRMRESVLRCETPDFISLDLRPLNSPDVNPANYSILSGVNPSHTGTCFEEISENCQ